MTTAAHSASDQPIREPIATPPSTGNIDPTPFPIVLEDFAYVDTETTGVDPAVDRICEIAIVRFRGGRREVFHTLVDPEMPIPPTASAVHHITDETIAEAKARGEAPTFAEIADKVGDMLDEAYVYAHSRDFDQAFVDAGMGVEMDPKSWLCTVRLARHLLPTAPAYGNQVLRYWLKTQPDSEGLGAHRAIDDVYVSLETTFHLFKWADALGVKTHEGLLELCNQTILVDTMNFGAHAGKPFKDVPSSYFEWALGRVPGKAGLTDMDDDLRASMVAELVRDGRKEDDARIKSEADNKIVPAATMAFGNKHNGVQMTLVPMDYLEWIEKDNPRCSAEVRAGVRIELSRRRSLEQQQRAGGAPAKASTPAAAAGNASTGARSNAGAHTGVSDAAGAASAVFTSLRALVNKGSDEEAHLLETAKARDPVAALIAYLKGFADVAPADFARVAALTHHADWMHQVARSSPARPAAAASPRAPVATPAEEPGVAAIGAPNGRLNLFAKRQSDPDAAEDSGGPPDFFEGDGAPFEAAPAPRRMRPR